MRILFLSQNLERGGAERQLTALAVGLAKRGHHVSVVTFYGGAYEAEIKASGCDVINLNKCGRWDIVPFTWRLAKTVRSVKPEVLHSYLPVPNIIAALLKPLMPNTVLVWGVRAADMDLSRYDRLTRLSYQLEKVLSFVPKLIIANAEKGKEVAVSKGFPEKKMRVIPNGIDTERFRHAHAMKSQVRYELGLPDDVPVIGMFARFDPMKDHATFLTAAEFLAKKKPSIRYLLAGQNVDSNNPAFASCASGPLHGKLMLLGPRNDVPRLMAALDLYCQSSAYGEGFPNVLGEAMACGVPCVATDVGDAGHIIGSTGRIVPPRDPAALAEAMELLLSHVHNQGKVLQEAARERIVTNFSLPALAERTENLLLHAVKGKTSS